MKKTFQIVSLKPATETIHVLADYTEAGNCDLCSSQVTRTYWTDAILSASNYRLVIEGTMKVCEHCLNDLRKGRAMKFVFSRHVAYVQHEAVYDSFCELKFSNSLLQTTLQDCLQTLKNWKRLIIFLWAALLCATIWIIILTSK